MNNELDKIQEELLKDEGIKEALNEHAEACDEESCLGCSVAQSIHTLNYCDDHVDPEEMAFRVACESLGHDLETLQNINGAIRFLSAVSIVITGNMTDILLEGDEE